jgi:isopropylmalate/homocitrate/citramalate synthase
MEISGPKSHVSALAPHVSPGPGDAHGREVVVVEVGPRDGLQNEAAHVPTDVKIAFVDALSVCGLPVIETTSFVNPRAVPQLVDAEEVMRGITRAPHVRYPVLVPNARGLDRAFQSGVDAIALFTAATEEFASANVGTTIAGTFERFAPVVAVARERQLWIRGYVSVAFGCPYAGSVRPTSVLAVAEKLMTLGCDEICLADTIGAAIPSSVVAVLDAAKSTLPIERLALHFHDTAGMALLNVAAALDYGVRVFDGASSGLGGCPFAPGAPGNLATERLVDFLEEHGLRTGVAMDGLARAIETLRPFVPKLAHVSA